MDLNEQWDEFGKEESYTLPGGFLEELDYELIESEVVDTWRWGNHNRDIYRSPSGELIGVDYRDASGDGEVDHWDMMAEFYPVELKEVTVVKYERVK